MFKDLLKTWQLKTRYQRKMQEQLLTLLESTNSPQSVPQDPGQWIPLGQSTSKQAPSANLLQQARHLASHHPHASNILRLLEIYVVGPGLKLTHIPIDGTTNSQAETQLISTLDTLWAQFLRTNKNHFSYREFARRTWRDGEAFLRKYPQANGCPQLRFIDPERIAATTEHPHSQGILTNPDDVETPIAYLNTNPQSPDHAEAIDAEFIHHTRFNVDSNAKRGLSLFAPLQEHIEQFDRWLEIELKARKLQSSIVLWRKVQGSPTQVSNVATQPSSSSPSDRILPGSILTTSGNTDIQFLQPSTNFGDAVPLGRLLLLCIAAGAGIPEFMLTSDASNANFSSTMVAEGPAVKLFQAQQEFIIGELTQLWYWIIEDLISAGLIPANTTELIQPSFTPPQIVSRDRPKERQADVQLVNSQILSRAEVARRDGVSPQQMQQEIATETTNQ